jgi:cellobiose dehydrogenase (acceptor)
VVWNKSWWRYAQRPPSCRVAREQCCQDEVCLCRVSNSPTHSVDSLLIFGSGYDNPMDYTGNATITQISHTVNDTHFDLVYRCQWCWIWNQDGAEGAQLPTSEVQVIGWAQHNKIFSGTWVQHNKGQSQFGAPVADARNAKYSSWVGTSPSATPIPSGTPTSTPISTPTSSPTVPGVCSGSPAPTESYDYIVIGGGAGGIPVADKLSESGKSVLLIERGPPSLARFGGTMGPEWVTSNNLSRFDVPGLCNQIWVDSAGVACTDIDQMAGCVLGGGAAVNAALWWKPVDVDFDYNFPTGWKSADVKGAIDRVFKRIPGTDTPSMASTSCPEPSVQMAGSRLSQTTNKIQRTAFTLTHHSCTRTDKGKDRLVLTFPPPLQGRTSSS